MTRDQLIKCMPFATTSNVDKFLEPLNNAMKHYQINTPIRIAAFIAQIAHESGSLKYVRELASGEAYEGRKDLGNTQSGDGKKFRGRGLIQITGRHNYTTLGKILAYDFINNPQDLELPGAASMSAGWYWQTHGLNEIADIDTHDSFVKITKKINGGVNGLKDRLNHWQNAKSALYEHIS
jgi:putative chitinase